MKQSDALIICEDVARGSSVAEKVAALGFVCRTATPQQLLDTTTSIQSDLICICSGDASMTQQLLAAIAKDPATGVTPTVLFDGEAAKADAAVQLLPSAVVADQSLAEKISQAMSESQRARQAGIRCDVSFRMLSNCKWIDALTGQLQQLYRSFGVDPESDHRLTTAVREMTHNAVEWGNRGVADASVLIRCKIDAFAVTLLIRDSGNGFNREQLPHAATSQDPTRHLHVRDELGLRAGGFGILMTRGLVDELNYNDAGNEVRIVKYFERK